MNLYQKTKQYLYLRNNRVRNALKLSYEGKLSASDYFAFTAVLCILVIVLTLKLSAYIDQLEVQEAIMRDAAEKNQSEAIRREEVIVSILNGSAIINGRIVSFCQTGAAGECK